MVVHPARTAGSPVTSYRGRRKLAPPLHRVLRTIPRALFFTPKTGKYCCRCCTVVGANDQPCIISHSLWCGVYEFLFPLPRDRIIRWPERTIIRTFFLLTPFQFFTIECNVHAKWNINFIACDDNKNYTCSWHATQLATREVLLLNAAFFLLSHITMRFFHQTLWRFGNFLFELDTFQCFTERLIIILY